MKSYENRQEKIVDLIAIFTAKPGKVERVCTPNDKYLHKKNKLKIIVGRAAIGHCENRVSE